MTKWNDDDDDDDIVSLGDDDSMSARWNLIKCLFAVITIAHQFNVIKVNFLSFLQEMNSIY